MDNAQGQDNIWSKIQGTACEVYAVFMWRVLDVESLPPQELSSVSDSEGTPGMRSWCAKRMINPSQITA